MNRTSAANYQKVIVALHLTACNELESRATNRRIGKVAGLSAKTVARYIGYAEADKLVREFSTDPCGSAYRYMIFVDHPKARAAIKLCTG